MSKAKKNQRRQELLVLLEFYQTQARKNAGTPQAAQDAEKIASIDKELAKL